MFPKELFKTGIFVSHNLVSCESAISRLSPPLSSLGPTLRALAMHHTSIGTLPQQINKFAVEYFSRYELKIVRGIIFLGINYQSYRGIFRIKLAKVYLTF